MKEKFRNWLKRRRYKAAVRLVARLEMDRKFIDPFFLGETMHKIKLEEHFKRMEEAKKKMADNS